MVDDQAVTNEEMKELRTLCFQKLVFYLNKKQIEDIYNQINSINFENSDSTMTAIGEITCILQNSLHAEESFRSSDLKKLFNSFNKTSRKLNEDEIINPDVDESDVHYWHFNTLYREPQINAFKYGNWVLALNEYGENWRTNMIREIRPNDIIFLFVRGGAGYIGAFRALDPTTKILEAGQDYTKAEISKYDIYNSLADGATLASNVLVEPIAINYKGIGSYSIRRKTIERMDDLEDIKLLLNKFEGNDLTKEQLSGKDKLAEDSSPKINTGYFEELMKHIQLK